MSQQQNNQNNESSRDLSVLLKNFASSTTSLLSWGVEKSGVRSALYNTTIGFFYTRHITRSVLDRIPEGSMILDVGVGTGYSYAKNSKLIKEKRLQIVGIDIDPEYTKTARHALIDYELESNVRIVLGDVYKVDNATIPEKLFDFVMFSDSYAVIPNVHSMMTFCEKFLKPSGQMLVISTLFDEKNQYVDWLKRNAVYATSVAFGEMMIKKNLEDYIKTRIDTKNTSLQELPGSLDEKSLSNSVPGTSEQIQPSVVDAPAYDFELIDEKIVPIYNYPFRTYIVSWVPKSN